MDPFCVVSLMFGGGDRALQQTSFQMGEKEKKTHIVSLKVLLKFCARLFTEELFKNCLLHEN